MIAILFLFLLATLFWYQNKNKSFGITSLLLTTYALMSLISIIVYFFLSADNAYHIKLESMLYLCIAFLISFYPFLGYRDCNLKIIYIENKNLFHFLEVLLIIGSLFSIIFFAAPATYSLSSNIRAYRMSGEYNFALGKYGIINTVASLFANCFIILQFFFFYHLTNRNNRKTFYRILLPLLCSLSFVVYVLAYVGRDGTVYWSMSFIFMILLFKNFLPKKQINRISAIFILILLLISLPFYVITKSRFSHTKEGSLAWIVIYLGQQPLNFNDAYSISTPLTMGTTLFPAFSRFLEAIDVIDVDQTHLSEQAASSFLYNDAKLYTFGTYVKSFLTNFGKIGTLIALLILSWFTKKSLRRVNSSGVFHFKHLLVFILFYQIIYYGVFYFRQYSANLYIIAILLISLLMHLFISNKDALLISGTNQIKRDLNQTSSRRSYHQPSCNHL